MAAKVKGKRKKTGSWYYRMSLSQKRGMWGWIFLAPWLIGFLLFFIRPFWNSVWYSFHDLTISIGNVEMQWRGIDHYIDAFTRDMYFNRVMLTLAYPALINVFIVVVFSLLAAMLINGKYPGRSVVRTIFFIPIIMGGQLATTAVGGVIAGDDLITEVTTAAVGFGGFGGGFFLDVLQATGLPANLTNFVDEAINQIFTILARSGVPILIFLAGLQSIPASLYEVATIEGSTKYESFWKVTLPMISPMVLLTTVYTIIDLFSRHSLHGMSVGTGTGAMGAGFVQPTQMGTGSRIQFLAINQGNWGQASAQATMFVIATMLVVGLVTFLMSKVVFYYDEV